MQEIYLIKFVDKKLKNFGLVCNSPIALECRIGEFFLFNYNGKRLALHEEQMFLVDLERIDISDMIHYHT